MKEEGMQKTPFSVNCKSKQYRNSEERQIVGFQSYESERLQDANQSSIAQEEILFQELKRDGQLKKKKYQLTDSSNYFKQPSENTLNKFNSDISFGNSRLLLGQSISQKTQIVTINQIKCYEQQAKSKIEGYKFPLELNFDLKVIEDSGNKNQKSMKKSLSSSKFAKEKLQSMQQKQKITNNNRLERQNLFKSNRSSLDVQSIKSSHEVSFSKTPSSKNMIDNVSSSLSPLTVPFSYQNINTTINNQQNLQVQSNVLGSQVQGQKRKQRKRQMGQRQTVNSRVKDGENKLLRQLNSTKYLIDAPLDINEFSYQLDLEINIQRNRGFQIYLLSPQKKSDGIYLEDVIHFKYEMVKLPPNIFRLRAYLLIQDRQKTNSKKNNQESPQKPQDIQFSPTHQVKQRQWKVWKEIQVPIMNTQQKNDREFSKKIKLSIINTDLNWVSVKINSMMEFNLKLSHHKVPVCYYCIDQDFNGVELTKLSIFGRERTKTTEDLIGQGCQGNCQLI